MIIVGIDPGSRITGFAALQRKPDGKMRVLEVSALKLNEKAPLPERLSTLADALELRFSKFKPDCVAIEQVFFAKNAKSALVLGHARGVVLLSAQRAGAKLIEFTPTEVKRLITGNGNANKEQVRKAVQLFGGPRSFDTHDASDALALAMTQFFVSRPGGALTPSPFQANVRR